MAKLNCICGNQLSNVASPNQTEGLILRDIDLEFNGHKDCIDILEMGRDVWECDQCGRLAISHPGKQDADVKWYKPEDGVPGRIMAFDKEAV